MKIEMFNHKKQLKLRNLYISKLGIFFQEQMPFLIDDKPLNAQTHFYRYAICIVMRSLLFLFIEQSFVIFFQQVSRPEVFAQLSSKLRVGFLVLIIGDGLDHLPDWVRGEIDGSDSQAQPCELPKHTWQPQWHDQTENRETDKGCLEDAQAQQPIIISVKVLAILFVVLIRDDLLVGFEFFGVPLLELLLEGLELAVVWLVIKQHMPNYIIMRGYQLWMAQFWARYIKNPVQYPTGVINPIWFKHFISSPLTIVFPINHIELSINTYHLLPSDLTCFQTSSQISGCIFLYSSQLMSSEALMTGATRNVEAMPNPTTVIALMVGASDLNARLIRSFLTWYVLSTANHKMNDSPMLLISSRLSRLVRERLQRPRNLWQKMFWQVSISAGWVCCSTPWNLASSNRVGFQLKMLSPILGWVKGMINIMDAINKIQLTGTQLKEENEH